MIELNQEEMEIINGGHNGSSYRAGVVVGDILEIAITVFGVGRIMKLLK